MSARAAGVPAAPGPLRDAVFARVSLDPLATVIVKPTDVPRRRVGRSLLAVTAALGVATAALAVPPPPARPDVALTPVSNGPEAVLRDTVRAYQVVPVAFAAQAGDRVLLRMEDATNVLVLGLEAPSGVVWLSGARPGPDGLEWRVVETGVHRVVVLMSSDAARSGRAASFELGLRLRR